MVAVRCAARRLGGSLLQRAQAAVSEEGRRLAPSKLMRCRHLSTQSQAQAASERAPEIEQKKAELRHLVSKAMQKKVELHDALAKADKNSVPFAEEDMRLLHHLSGQEAAPEPWYWVWKKFATMAGRVLEKTAKTTVSVMLTACAISIVTDKEVKAITKEGRQ